MRKKINENEKYYHNAELVEEAKRQDFPLPQEHELAILNKQMLLNDFEKYHKPINWNPRYDKLKIAFEALKRIKMSYMGKSNVWTFDQAIQSAEKSTAPGKLFKDMGFTDKRAVFEHMKAELLDSISDICLGKVVDTIWETSPKIEIRHLEKLINEDLSKRKQRTFMCCDVLMYIVGLILFGVFNTNYLKLAHYHQWSSVGSSIFYGGWDRIARNLKRRFKVKGYDVKAMEASISAYLFAEIYKDRRELINVPADYDELWDWYMANLIYSKVLDLEGNLAITIGKNPSGNTNTLNDNTDVLSILYLYCLACNSETVEEVLIKHDQIPLEAVGDDSLFGDSKELANIEQTSAELGFQFTPETDGAVYLEEARFLNFGFVYNTNVNMYTFEPNYDKLWASLYYYRKNNSWRLTLAKLCAMRVLCYNSKNTQVNHLKIVDYFIDYIWKYHLQDIKNETHLDNKITFHSLQAMNLSNEKIEFLLFGLESQCTDSLLVSDETYSLLESEINNLRQDVDEIIHLF